MFKTVAIIGVGLIGGSLGLCLKQRQLAKHIIGIGRNPEKLAKALHKGAVHEITTDLGAIGRADLIIIATPVKATIDLVPEIARFIRPDCYVTDVGSTKQLILETMEKHLEGRYFIGSHPMAGSEVSGVDGSFSDMFENAPLILTPSRLADNRTLVTMQEFWARLGTKVVVMDAADHDMAVGVVSHLPYLSAVSLMKAADDAASQQAEILELAAGGFRDCTRVAAADPVMWRDIILTNNHNIVTMLERLRLQITYIEEVVRNKDGDSLMNLFQHVKKSRVQMNAIFQKRRRGAHDE